MVNIFLINLVQFKTFFFTVQPIELKYIQKEFKKNNSGPIVKLGAHYDTLKETLLSSSRSQARNNILLYGFQGSGRKSAVLYAKNEVYLEKGQKINPLWVDAGVFQTENEFALELARQINIICKTGQDISKNDIFENAFTFKNLQPYLLSQTGVWVLVVEKIENLATQKRQSVLYAFLDWLQNNENKLTLIGITTDLKFTEKLEKRVKSRFSAEEIHCVEYELEGCLALIKSRFQKIGQNKNDHQLCNHLEKIFDQQSIKNFFETNIMNLMKPISYMINIVHTMLCLIDEEQLQKKIDNNVMDFYCYELLKQAYNLHQPPQGLSYVGNLAEPEKQVLLCIKKMIENEKHPINLNTIVSELIQHRRRYQYGTNQNFTLRVLQKATENLINLRILRILGNEEGEANGKLDETKDIILAINIDDLRTYLAENLATLANYLQDLAN